MSETTMSDELFKNINTTENEATSQESGEKTDGTFSYEERRQAEARESRAEMIDGVKEVGLGILAFVGFFVYFTALVAFISFVLVDAWTPHYIQMLFYAGCASVVAEVLYIIARVQKKKAQKKMKRYLES